MKILLTEALPEFEYIKEEARKTMIVLHHTVSAVGKYVDDWFKADKGKSRVAVAYVIDKDGSIYQLFDPKYWAYHIGKGSEMRHNQKSIGIEIVNEGPLYKIEDTNEYRWWIDNDYPQGRYKYEGVAFESPSEWRGYHYFASYTEEQMRSVMELLDYLIPLFGIKSRCIPSFDYDKGFLDYKGVIMHCNVREDKTDLSVAFNISRIAQHIAESSVPPTISFDVFNPQPSFISDAIVDNQKIELALSSKVKVEPKKKDSEKTGTHRANSDN